MKDQNESGQRISKNQGIVKESKQIKGLGQQIERIKGSRQGESKDQMKKNWKREIG